MDAAAILEWVSMYGLGRFSGLGVGIYSASPGI